jgi:hypothetical protein
MMLKLRTRHLDAFIADILDCALSPTGIAATGFNLR